ncbi:MAG: HEAT repeat domain-containing protein [Acidimicrobiia bacterium]|nr:HEAT repeat domain-containing protein [Acidimicrobiia bacterium]
MTRNKDTLFKHCRSIAVAGHRGDHETVLAALDRPEPEVRRMALGAAARLGLLNVTRMEGFLRDPSAQVRYRALELLPGLDHSARAVDAVIALLDDPDLAEVAAFTLGELPIDEGELPRVSAALESQARTHRDALCRESAVAALGSLATGLDAIVQACDDIATVRRRAVLALAPFDGPEVEAALRRALEDRDWQVRQAAEDLLGPESGSEPDPSVEA